MGSTSPKIAAAIDKHKEKRRPNTSSSTRPTTPQRPSSRRSTTSAKTMKQTHSSTRSQSIWATRLARLASIKANNLTRRITRSMTKKAAEETSTDTTPESSRDSTPDKIGEIDEIDLKTIPIDHKSDIPEEFPTILNKIIPRLELAGKHRCGKHRRAVGCLTLPSPPCRDCKKAGLPITELHTLPCGHVLCLPCLNAKATSIGEGIYDIEVWDSLIDALHDAEYEETFYDYDGIPHGEGPPKSALKALDMLCCGRDSRMDRYLLCMDQTVATNYWVAHQAVRAVNADNLRSLCGWPDCERQLVPACVFVRDQMYFSYCVCCGGFSLIKPIDGSTVPSRTWYEGGRRWLE